jgi:hypothetical protein
MPGEVDDGAVRATDAAQGARLCACVDLVDESFLQVGDADDSNDRDKEASEECCKQAYFLPHIKAHGGDHWKWQDENRNVRKDVDWSSAKVQRNNVDALCLLVASEGSRDGTTLEDVNEGEDDAGENDNEADGESGVAKEWTSLRHAIIQHED